MEIRVTSDPLELTESEAFFKLHQAAVEWSLLDPIIIKSSKDIQSRNDWRDRVEPFVHQVENLMRFCRRLPVTLLADDVGLGKTISAGLILSELMVRGRVGKCFIICPKILIPQWIEELEAKFGIQAYGAVGRELAEANKRSESVVLTTYQSASAFLAKSKPGCFDMLILDEAHKIRNLHGGRSKPKMAKAVFDALESRAFQYVLMLTATPIQNRLWDLYSLIDCLAVAKGHSNPLGTPDQFASRFIADGKSSARRVVEGRSDEFRGIVNAYINRTRRVDAKLAFPERIVKTNVRKPSESECRLQKLVSSQIASLSGLQQSSILVALMSSPHALATQVNNMAVNGTVSHSFAVAVAEEVERIIIPAKAKGLLRILREVASQEKNYRVVVFTTRKETQQMLGRVLKEAGISCGFISGGKTKENQKAIAEFVKDNPSIHVLVSTDAGAEGVNLHAANVLVNYDLPWNPMVVEQRIGRIQRLGSKFKNVLITNIVQKDSPESEVVVRLHEKLQVIAEAVGDIEQVLTEVGDDGQSFETQMRQLVVKALLGQDQKKETRLKAESIQEAKLIIEEQRELMDATLGPSKGKQPLEVTMPSLRKRKPRLSLQELVLSALDADGGELKDYGGGVFAYRGRSLPRYLFSFDSAVETDQLIGQSAQAEVVLYKRGKPEFERLVQKWRQKHSALITEVSLSELEHEALAEEWLAKFGVHELVACSREKRVDSRFDGTVTCVARVGNAIDSYEKVVELQCEESCKPRVKSLGVRTEIEASQLISNYKPWVNKCLVKDTDLKKFCDYYSKRLEREMTHAGTASLRKKLQSDLKPVASAETVSINGHLKKTYSIYLSYKLEGEEVYKSELVFCDGEVVQVPEEKFCTTSRKLVPVDCLGICEESGESVLRDLMGKCEISKKLVCCELLTLCELTGKQLLKKLTAVCDVSGIVGYAVLMNRSVISGRMLSPAESRLCGFTQGYVAADEYTISSVSGKGMRIDEGVEISRGNRVGHQSEVSKCEFSGIVLPTVELVESAFSGKVLDREEGRESDKSGRVGHYSEFSVCEETGASLLNDEVVVCDVSKKTLDDDLVWTCAETDRTAHHSYFDECQESGDLVLSDCLMQCMQSLKRVKPSLLLFSDESKVPCLAKLAVRCASTGKMVLPKEVDACSVSGKLVCRSALLTCAESGSRLIEAEASTCTVSSNVYKRDLVVACPETKRLVHRQYLAACEESGEMVLASCRVECAASGKLVRPSLVIQSVESGRLCIESLAVYCTVSGGKALPSEVETCEVSKKVACRSHFVTCEESKSLVLQDQVEVCSKTGKRVRRDLLLRCAESEQFALPEFLGRCGYSNEACLHEYLENCCETGKTCRRSLMSRSSKSNRYCVTDLMLVCADSGSLLLVDETAVCSVSGKSVDKDLLVFCELSNEPVREACRHLCVFTGKRVREDLLATCPESGKRGLKTRMVECQASGKLVAPGLLAECAETKQQVRLSLLGKSEKTGQVGQKELLRPCDVSGANVFPSEMGRCSYTGKTVDKDLLGRCEDSDAVVLVEHLEECDVTGQKVGKHLLAVCPDSERKALERLFRVCEHTSVKVLPEMLGLCDHSKRTVRKNLLVKSDVSDLVCVGHDLKTCQLTNVRMLPDEGEECFLTGELCNPAALVTCEETGVRISPTRIAVCSVTAKRVRDDLVSVCIDTGKTLLNRCMEVCEVTNVSVHPDAMVACAATAVRGRRQVFTKSEASGKPCDPRVIVHCQKTGIALMPDERGQCSLTGQAVDVRLLGICKNSRTVALSELLVKSTATGNLFLSTETEALPNGKVVGRGEVASCNWTREILVKSDLKICVLSGLYFRRDYVNESGEFVLLRDCLDGKAKNSVIFPKPSFLAEAVPRIFGKVHTFKWISDASKKCHVFFGKTGRIGFGGKRFAVFAVSRGSGFSLKGYVVFAVKQRGAWVTDERILMTRKQR